MRPVEVVADYVKRRREQLGLTQPELAERSGVSLQTIKLLETVRLENPPKLANLRKLAKALRVPPEAIISLAAEAPDEDLKPILPDGTILTPLLVRLVQELAVLPEEEQARQLVYFQEQAKRVSPPSRTPRAKAVTQDA